jgi:hypothetical protein
MAKRLFDGLDRGLGEEILVLEGLPETGGAAAYCPLCEALRQALRLLGREVSYERLMGLTGAAFMLPPGEGPGAERYLAEALAGLGVSARREESAGPEAALAQCRAELRAGRPVLAEGGQNDWAVIVGLRGHDLLGIVPGSEAPLERQAPEMRALWLLAAPDELPPPEETDEAALRRGVELLAENEARWEAWQERLAAAEPYGPEIGRRERFVAEQLLCAGLVEARDAAAQFLAEMAEGAEEDVGEKLVRAAQEAERLADLLEQLLAPPEVMEGARAAEDEVWLEARRERLAEARRQETVWRERLRAYLSDVS